MWNLFCFCSARGRRQSARSFRAACAAVSCAAPAERGMMRRVSAAQSAARRRRVEPTLSQQELASQRRERSGSAVEDSSSGDDSGLLQLLRLLQAQRLRRKAPRECVVSGVASFWDCAQASVSGRKPTVHYTKPRALTLLRAVADVGVLRASFGEAGALWEEVATRCSEAFAAQAAEHVENAGGRRREQRRGAGALTVTSAGVQQTFATDESARVADFDPLDWWRRALRRDCRVVGRAPQRA